MSRAAQVKHTPETGEQDAKVKKKQTQEKAALQREETEPERINEAQGHQNDLDAFHSGDGRSLSKAGPFQARMRLLNIPLNGHTVLD